MHLSTPRPHRLKSYFRSKKIPQVALAASLQIPISSLTAYLAGYLDCPRPVESRLIDFALNLEEESPSDDCASLLLLKEVLESRIQQPYDQQLSLQLDRVQKVLDSLIESEDSTVSSSLERRKASGK